MTMPMTPIRTWGEAARRMTAAAQFWIGVAQRTEDEEVREYARAMATNAIDKVQATEGSPTRPFGQRKAGVPCAVCGRPVWLSASRVWDASHGGAHLSPARCPDCLTAAVARADAERVTAGRTAPAEATPGDVAACVSEIVALDRELFGDRWENPERLAQYAIGAFDQLAARWQGLQSVLVGLIGESAARRALWAARREAGTDTLVRPPAREPDPVVDDVERDSSHAPEQCVPKDSEPEPNDVYHTHDDWVI